MDISGLTMGSTHADYGTEETEELTERMREAMKEGLLAQGTKFEADTMNMIENGKQQSLGKALSAAAKTGNGVNF